jgi:peptide subunit release factor 1 (eRF1)
MDTQVHDLLYKLAAIEPQPAPDGEPGLTLAETPEGVRYLPVLSVYLDWRPEATGERPALRAARVVVKDRLRQIQHAFWPRGAAYDAMLADAARIKHYLDEEAPPSAEGLAIFACESLGLFETLEAGVPFATEVMASATPNLYPLARLLDDQETAIVAVVNTHTARIFVSHRGLLRELKGLARDPKYFHLLKGAVAMEQAHYQRYAITQRNRFAEEVAQQLDRLVTELDAAQVILAGDDVAAATLKAALTPRVAALLHVLPLHIDIGATRDEVWDEVAPMVRETEAEHDRSLVERLMGEALSARLGVVGLEETRDALTAGQANTLILLANGSLTGQLRNQLISLATKTGADVEVVDDNVALAPLGDVGALLRYRPIAAPRPTPPTSLEPPELQPVP